MPLLRSVQPVAGDHHVRHPCGGRRDLVLLGGRPMNDDADAVALFVSVAIGTFVVGVGVWKLILRWIEGRQP